MKAKTMVARSTEGMFAVLMVVIALAVLAAPAMADDETGLQVAPLAEALVAGDLQIREIEGIQLAEDDEAGIPEGGDWEMVPSSPVFPDAGHDEVVGPDEFEDPVFPDAGGDEVVTPQEDEESEPATETPQPEEPEQSTEETATPNDKPSLPFTGGNGTPYAIAGLVIALVGVAVLIRKRHAFDR